MDKTTAKLDRILEHISWDKMNLFFEEHREELLTTNDNFTAYICELKKKKKFQWKHIFAKIGMEEHYGSDIIRMRKHPNDRNLILKICIAAHFSHDETQHTLRLYGVKPLYSRDPRDVILIMSLVNRVYNFEIINEKLKEKGLEEIMVYSTMI